MELSPAQYRLASLPSAFAAACRDSRSDAELFERCRDALVRRFHSDQIWFVIAGQGGIVSNIGTAEGRTRAVEVSRIKSGETEVVIWAEPGVAREMGGVATPLALGLSVVLELRTELLERQASLDDATFQLRALRQVTRLLSSVHSTDETEQLVMDFIAEVFFAWWACLYRPEQDEYVPRAFRALNEDGKPTPLNRIKLDHAFPVGSGVVRTDDIALASYEVLRNGSVIATLPPTTTSNVDPGAGEGTATYVVRATDSGGHSASSEPAQVIVDRTAPALAASNVTVEATGAQTPVSYTIGSIVGAPGTWTLLGPPLRISPRGRRAASSSAVIVCGTISL